MQVLLQQGDIKNGCKIIAKLSGTCFVIEKKDKCIFLLICHQYVLHTCKFIFFGTITVYVHGLMCGEIQISEEFEYKHFRGAINEFSGFQKKFDCRHRA